MRWISVRLPGVWADGLGLKATINVEGGRSGQGHGGIKCIIDVKYVTLETAEDASPAVSCDTEQ